MSTSIDGILGGSKTLYSTFGPWIKKTDDKKTSDLATFLKGNSKDKYTGLSEEATYALITFEHTKHRTEVEATKQLNRFFPNDKASILFWLLDLILFHLQEQHKNIAQVKQSLKWPAPIEDKPKAPAKKVKK